MTAKARAAFELVVYDAARMLANECHDKTDSQEYHDLRRSLLKALPLVESKDYRERIGMFCSRTEGAK
jgi:hypothetical protein